MACKYPQSAYVGFTQSLQAECQYIFRCVPYVGQHLNLVEVDIRGKLIPALLDLPPEEVTDELRALLSHDVKQGGLNFRKPATGAARLNQASVEASTVLVESLLGNGELKSYFTLTFRALGRNHIASTPSPAVAM